MKKKKKDDRADGANSKAPTIAWIILHQGLSGLVPRWLASQAAHDYQVPFPPSLLFHRSVSFAPGLLPRASPSPYQY